MEDVDGGGAAVVTTEQPRSPLKLDRGEGAEHTAVEAAEQQMLLIHEEYKRLLREKEVQVHDLLQPTVCSAQLQ